MSTQLRFTILVERDGVALPNMPIVRTYTDTEVTGVNAFTQAADSNSSSYHEIAALTMPTLGVFMLTTDLALNAKFNLNTPIPLNADSVVLLLGCALAQGTATQNVELNNPSTTTAANVTVLGAGT